MLYCVLHAIAFSFLIQMQNFQAFWHSSIHHFIHTFSPFLRSHTNTCWHAGTAQYFVRVPRSDNMHTFALLLVTTLNTDAAAYLRYCFVNPIMQQCHSNIHISEEWKDLTNILSIQWHHTRQNGHSSMTRHPLTQRLLLYSLSYNKLYSGFWTFIYCYMYIWKN